MECMLFAFMTKRKKIWLARDIPGEKPLYYYHKGKKFIFVSEAKSLQKILNISKRNDKFYNAFQHCLDKTLWKMFINFLQLILWNLI